MKYPVTRFKNLKVALKEIEPMVRDPRLVPSARSPPAWGSLPRGW
jgi:hypothetical protein